MPLSAFHPAVEAWFRTALGEPTPPQQEGWPAIRAGQHTLIAAPTGSGKTLTAFLSAIDELMQMGIAGDLRDETYVLYVSPLKALSNDIKKNLRQPLEGIGAELEKMGLHAPEIRVAVRTGDTPSSERTKITKRPPHIFVTTPESLYIMLTSVGGRNVLKTVRTVIVDEIHAIADDKRGSHLSLSLERLAHLVAKERCARSLDSEKPSTSVVTRSGFDRVEGPSSATRDLVRIGLSATQRPIERVAQFLVGDGGACTIVDTGHKREIDLAIELTSSPLEAVMPAEVWTEIYERLVELIRSHKSTLIFVNTRRLSERLTAQLASRLGDDAVTSHHGSLSKEHRLDAEQRLKAGKLSALVATASLELGIDIGDVDLVCQIGSPRSIATLLQRVGRSGHAVRATPKGRVFPLTRDELVEITAILWAIQRDELDQLEVPVAPLDILAQQIVAASANDEWDEDELFALVRRAYPYRELEREDFDAVLRMLAEGFSTRRGRRGAQIHRDAVNKRIRGRRGARLAAITSGGAIPDNADYYVVLEPTETIIGTINEDFAIESLPGDIFQLGNHSWQILKVEPGKVRVQDAEGQPPTLPFWLGEAPARTAETSLAVSGLRAEVSKRLPDGPGDLSPAMAWVRDQIPGVGERASTQLVEYLHLGHCALGLIPTQDDLVVERFFDESGGMQLVVHSPHGGRLNRAWGLTLRKKFCQSFNFELQAAATEDAIVLSLGPTHSFPLDDVFRFVHSNTARETLTQAMLDAPMFPTRWRWNASRALAILRWRSGKRVAPALQRMNADDLLAVVFPDSLACFENIQGGKREIPDHPLVNQTVYDCLTEAMDIEGFEGLLRSIEAGERRLHARDLREPSPLAAEILNARPYAFLDDAPLEERRTQAVFQRRFMDAESASELGQLDQSAIDRVREETWPTVRDVDELHEALLLLGYATNDEVIANDWGTWMQALASSRRAGCVTTNGRQVWVAAERLAQMRAAVDVTTVEPEIETPAEFLDVGSAVESLTELVRGRLEGLGPVTVAALAESIGLEPSAIEMALVALEAEGFVFRGQFTPGFEGTEWCERRLLARIHRYTLQRLRKEIEPISASDYMRFLFRWQHVLESERLEGADAVGLVVDQLEGYETAAGAWEAEILPARMRVYDPAWLDNLCLSGQIVWGRLSGTNGSSSRGPVRATPVGLLRRTDASLWRRMAARGEIDPETLSANARAVYQGLLDHGASFFAELRSHSRLLKTQLEEALGELVAAGVVTADSFSGLRALLLPAAKRDDSRRRSRGRRKMSTAVFEIENAGRWSLFAPDRGDDEPPPDLETSRQRRLARFYSRYDPEVVDHAARVLLRRYGIVFRRLLERERLVPGWGELLRAYRMMEARGEIRGGRFVNGFSGEQFALPEAVGLARSVRRAGANGEELVCVSASDPLNLTGFITAGERISAVLTNQILYRDGVPIAALENGKLKPLISGDIGMSDAALKATLVKRPLPGRLRQYLH